MTEKEKLAKLEETMELDEGTLTPEMALDDIDEYDSMTKLLLTVMFQADFGKEVTPEQLKGFETVADILAMMDN